MKETLNEPGDLITVKELQAKYHDIQECKNCKLYKSLQIVRRSLITEERGYILCVHVFLSKCKYGYASDLKGEGNCYSYELLPTEENDNISTNTNTSH